MECPICYQQFKEGEYATPLAVYWRQDYGETYMDGLHQKGYAHIDCVGR